LTTPSSFGRGLSFLALALVVVPLLTRDDGEDRDHRARLALHAEEDPSAPRMTIRRADRPAPSDSARSEIVLRVWPLAPTEPRIAAPVSAPAPPYDLLIPVAGVRPDDLTDTFGDLRDSTRTHRAIDILAPTGTPVVAAVGGRILRLHTSALGGLTVYQMGPTNGWVYYYAHLDGYAEGLRAGQIVAAGDTLGFVGETGNAPIPHLHFAVWKVRPGTQRGGRAVNPYPLLTDGKRP
jgi:murein DD-endopeptidase MepM/ murein hydrolase activator NlpD